MLLVVRPSTDPDDLWIQAGDGKKWGLRLMSGNTVPDAEVPEVVDHFPASMAGGDEAGLAPDEDEGARRSSEPFLENL